MDIHTFILSISKDVLSPASMSSSFCRPFSHRANGKWTQRGGKIESGLYWVSWGVAFLYQIQNGSITHQGCDYYRVCIVPQYRYRYLELKMEFWSARFRLLEDKQTQTRRYHNYSSCIRSAFVLLVGKNTQTKMLATLVFMYSPASSMIESCSRSVPLLLRCECRLAAQISESKTTTTNTRMVECATSTGNKRGCSRGKFDRWTMPSFSSSQSARQVRLSNFSPAVLGLRCSSGFQS